MRSFTVSSPLPPRPLTTISTFLSSPTFMQASHLTHPIGTSSLPPTTSMSLSHSLEWHMLIRPFKEIANRLAHFWSYLSVNLPSPLRLSLWDFLPGHGRGCYRHYRSLAEEQKWWDESARIRAFFASSDARYDGRRAKKVSPPEHLSPIPLIMSYVPRLLPRYRDHSRLDDAATECELTTSVYRKWHRLVFPDEVRPATDFEEKAGLMDVDNRCRLYRPKAKRGGLLDTSARVIVARSRELRASFLTRLWHREGSHRHRHTETSGRAGSNTRALT
jgi:hypothetical protein